MFKLIKSMVVAVAMSLLLLSSATAQETRLIQSRFIACDEIEQVMQLIVLWKEDGKTPNEVEAIIGKNEAGENKCGVGQWVHLAPEMIEMHDFEVAGDNHRFFKVIVLGYIGRDGRPVKFRMAQLYYSFYVVKKEGVES